MKLNKLTLTLVRSVALPHTSCGDSTGPGNQNNGPIAIVNDPYTLGARVTYYDDDIPLDTTGVGYPSALMSPSASLASRGSNARMASYQLKLKAEVAPPSISGQVLQATSVSIVGNLAVVSYNMVGNPYLGGVDVIDISNQNHPVLLSQALFQNTDVSAVTTSGANVFVAEATGDTGFAYPAVFESMQLQGNQLVLSGNRRMGLTSFVATSVAASGTKAYATTGDAGSLFVINPTTFAKTDSVALQDARWVAVGGGKVVVVQVPLGQISVFNESNMSPVGTFPFYGAYV